MEGNLATYLLVVLMVGWAAYAYLRARTLRAAARRGAAPGRNRRSKTDSPRRSSAQRTYHSVSVVIPTGKSACEAVRQIKHMRYLSDDAPPLPLPGCEAERCFCVYRHHSDRRKGDDRRTPLRGHVPRYGFEERRTARGRRESDYEAA